MTFELFCPVFNEEYLIPYLVEFYRKQLGAENIKFNFYDNGSTDSTIQVAKDLGCNVGIFETNGEIRDDLLLSFKNTIWKGSLADFVIVIDCDEFIDIDFEKLRTCTLVQCEGWQMVGNGQETPLEINRGHRLLSEDKTCIFSPHAIQEINYTVGAHSCQPVGDIVKCDSLFKLYHMKAISEDYLVEKYRSSKSRLSKLNMEKGWGYHYLIEEEEIRQGYKRSLTDENYKKIR